MEDYLKAYTSAGRAPVPVPQEPTEPQARATLDLPPLFEPYAELTSGESSAVTLDDTANPITDPTKLPRIQAFQPVLSEGDTYQSIVAVPEYSFFSPEVSAIKGCFRCVYGPLFISSLEPRNFDATPMPQGLLCRLHPSHLTPHP